MDYLVIKTAFELLSYVRESLNDGNARYRDVQRLKLLYNLLNDFITSSLEKEKGVILHEPGTKK